MFRKPLIVISVIGSFVALLVAAHLMLETPLSSPTGEGKGTYIRARALSEPAIAGMLNFGDHCSDCHGTSAEGSRKAPSLLDRSYAVNFRDSRLFHEEVARDIPAHKHLIQAGEEDSPIDFNSVEMMSKFLREMRRNKELKEE